MGSDKILVHPAGFAGRAKPKGFMTMDSQNDSAPKKSAAMRALPLVAIVVVAAVGYFTLQDYLSFDALRENREALNAFRDGNYLLAALIFIAAYVCIVTFSLPGAAVASLTGGFLFGVVFGSVFNVLSAGTGAILIFLAARMGFGERLSAKLDASEGSVKKLKESLNDNEVSVMLLMRLVPAVPFFLANLIPAMVGVRTLNFIWTTYVGIIPGAIVYTSVGAGLGEVFDRGENPDLGLIFEPYILFPILGLCLLALLPILVKFFRRGRGDG